MPFLKVGESRSVPCNLYYQTHGTGTKKVFFVMGLLMSHRAWRTQVNAFRKEQPKEYFPQNETDDMFLDDYQICVYDNRGAGQSDSPSGRYTTSMMAADALELLQHLKWEEVHVVGISMGGMISQELAYLMTSHAYAASQPRLLSLSLSCTHAGGRYAFSTFEGVTRIGKSLFIKDVETRVKNSLPLLYSEKHLAIPENFERYWRAGVERSKLDGPSRLTTFVGHTTAVQTHYVSEERLAQIRDSGVPILLLTGDEDKLVRWQNSNILNSLLKPAEYVVFKGSGHGINHENRDEFNAALFRNFQRGIDHVKQGQQ